MEHGVLIWQRKTLLDAHKVAQVCREHGVRRVAVKVLDGTFRYNAANDAGGDRGLIEYLDVLREAGLEVEGWGYHYPDTPGPQGDAIEERRQKLGLTTYHIDMEMEWVKSYGMPAAAKTLLNKLKVGGFEALICTFRQPLTNQAAFPIYACAYHEAVDGWSPQVYWALAHNQTEQLEACLREYGSLPGGKPVYPMGPIHGGTYNRQYWEPTVGEVREFRQACERLGMRRVYWYSLDWVMSNNRLDLLAAATGQGDGGIVPSPPPVVPPAPVETLVVRVATDPTKRPSLWTHKTPDIGAASRNGFLPYGSKMLVEEQRTVAGKLWYRSGDGWFASWLCEEERW